MSKKGSYGKLLTQASLRQYNLKSNVITQTLNSASCLIINVTQSRKNLIRCLINNVTEHKKGTLEWGSFRWIFIWTVW